MADHNFFTHLRAQGGLGRPAKRAGAFSAPLRKDASRRPLRLAQLAGSSPSVRSKARRLYSVRLQFPLSSSRAHWRCWGSPWQASGLAAFPPTFQNQRNHL